ncbi:DUF4301 family protein [Labilibacter sediminis]|nr:DUF4301 family protein [Labilibacter sediminis]
MLKENDHKLLITKEISIDKVNQQLEQFKNGFPFMDIKEAASINNGIISLNEEEKLMFTDKYREGIDNGCSVIKFVPASGAATRMFKDLFSFIHADTSKQEEMKKSGVIKDFLSHIKYFAFAEGLSKACNINFDDEKLVFENGAFIIKKLLLADGLNYGTFPKGVLKFHQSALKATTPIEEHLNEGAAYGQDNEGLVNIHFTVSGDHQSLFEEIIDQNLPLYEAKHDVKFQITYSTQKGHTDTIAVNPDNTPFRTKEEELLFRPGGHGALIENLNELDADIIFIKNIDNVVPEHRLKDTIQYKEALAGVLYHYQDQVFEYLKLLNSDTVSSNKLQEILDFMQQELFIAVPDDIISGSEKTKADFVFQKLNRPIRVCGMVKNEGEPGGGPFWGIGKNGEVSLQVVESSQIDMNQAAKKEIVNHSTHFNPVDLVCGTRNYKEEKFNLLDYVDPKTGFISNKSLGGKELKALELPGLWNGAMSDWITLFVEVPVSTFNPVKTVNDLLRIQHQPESAKSHS